MKWYFLVYCKIFLFILFGCFLPTFTKLYEVLALSNSIENERIDTVEKTKDKHLDSKAKNIIDLKDNLFPNAEIKNALSEDIEREVSDLNELLATTAAPRTTYFPHGFVFPGTKWCGKGDIAKSEYDLGSLKKTDNCCRAHDHCPDYTLPGETKYNLTNEEEYTRMSCDCDRAFYECLKEAKTVDSSLVIKIYFNIFKRKCFELDYPRKCKHYNTDLKLCDEFESDTSAEKIYQWIILKF